MKKAICEKHADCCSFLTLLKKKVHMVLVLVYCKLSHLFETYNTCLIDHHAKKGYDAELIYLQS